MIIDRELQPIVNQPENGAIYQGQALKIPLRQGNKLIKLCHKKRKLDIQGGKPNDL